MRNTEPAMPRNDDIRVVSSSTKIPLPPKPLKLNSPFETARSHITNAANSVAQLIYSLSLTDERRGASLFSEEEAQQKTRQNEERVPISKVLVRNKDGLPANIAVPLNKLSGFKKYKISDILFFDRNRKTKVSSDDSFSQMVTLRPGGEYTRAQLQKELESLATSGMFEKVDFEGKTNADGTMAITVSFSESTWESADRFRCINVGLMQQTKPVEMDPAMTDKERMKYYLSQERDYKKRMEKSRPCLLPESVHVEIMELLKKQRTVSAGLLQKIRDRVQKWYHDEGYACAQVVNFGNLNAKGKEVVCEVVEGDITQLSVQFQDKLGNVVEGDTQVSVVQRELPRQLRPGYTFNIEAGKQALRNINSLGLFSNIEVNPRPDENSEGGIVVEMKLKELEQKTAEVSTEWSIVPGQQLRDFVCSINLIACCLIFVQASLQPGGTVTFEHRILQGLNRSVTGSITTGNFSNPRDDLAFKLDYAQPYLDGVDQPRNRTLHVNCFNSRKPSPVFTGGLGVDEVPALKLILQRISHVRLNSLMDL